MNSEIEEINQLMPEVFEEFDLIPKKDDSHEEDIKSTEGIHGVPYKSKEPVLTMSENNSCPSQISVGGSIRDNISSPCIRNRSSGSHEEDDHIVTPSVIKPEKVLGNKRQSDDEQLNSKAPAVKDMIRKSTIFELAKFDEIKSTIIEEEKEKYENTPKDKKDGNPLTSFEKKFKLNKGEKLLDSFTCAVSNRILLHGRLYITNQRICFYSMFNSKLLFFGKDTKITIPLDDIMSLEKRINALVFDNSIAVITKNEKETFFTSFLMRDRAFEVIKKVLEDESTTSGKKSTSINMLKRTFVRAEDQMYNGKSFLNDM